MKTFKEFLAEKGITEDKYAEMSAKEVAKLHSEYQDAIGKHFTDAFEEFKKDNDTKEATKQFEAFQKVLEAQGEVLTKLEARGVETKKDGAVLKAIKDNAEDIKKAVDQKGHIAKFTVKADVLRASVTASTQALRLDSIGQLAHRKFVLRDLFPKVPVGPGSNGVIRYADWDEASKVRAAAMVAEGAAFPESTAVWEEFTLNLRKIGDSIPKSEELMQDAPRFARELEEFLRVNIGIIEDDQLYDGDGTGQNLTGIFTTAEEYVAAASGISAASIYDLIVKISEDMTSGKRSKYMPNFALMNIVDINKMRLEKDANENYITPPFVTDDGTEVAGILIVESAAVTADTMLVGDSRWATIYEVEGFNVETGHINDQFTKDMITLKASQREAILVRVADRGGFKKETGIAAALVTLAT